MRFIARMAGGKLALLARRSVTGRATDGEHLLGAGFFLHSKAEA
jgi:hypothetical protein